MASFAPEPDAAPAQAWAPARRVALRVSPVGVLRATVLLIVVGNLGRIPLLDAQAKQAPLLFNDLFVLACVTLGALAMLRARSALVDLPAVCALCFAAVGAVGTVVSAVRYDLTWFELGFSLAYLGRWLLYFGLYIVAINCVRRGDVERVWRAIETAVLGIAGFGVVQAALLPNFAQLVYPESREYLDWDPQGHRLVSTILDPNFVGAMLLVVLLVQLARLSFGARERAAHVLLLFAALALTASRSSVLGLLVGSLVIVWVRGLRRNLVRIAAIVCVVAAPFVPALIAFAAAYHKLSIDASALMRLVAWARALAVFLDHPIVGIGFNTYGFVQRAYGWEATGQGGFSLEGGLLFVAVLTGIVGLALYGGMISAVLGRCRRVWSDVAASAEERGMALGVAAGTAALLVHSLFINSLIYPFVMELVWILWALTLPMRQGAPVACGPSVGAARAWLAS